MAYVKIIFQNSPSTATPMNAQNLNHMDDQIALNDQRLTEIETSYVKSFKGRTEDVVPEKGDYDISQIDAADGQNGYVPVWRNDGTEQSPDWKFKMEPQSGSGTGGHTIVDQDGTSMATENSLQFADSFVSDDSVNGRTIVENIKEHTTASDYENATEDGIHVYNDGNDVPIGASSDDKVEVTADGDKTYATLLNEIATEMDFSKVRDNAYLAIILANGDKNIGVLRANYGTSVTFFQGLSESTGARIRTYYIEDSNSQFEESTGSSYSDKSTTKPANGTKITLYYGTSSTVINLKTDANYCQYDENNSIKDILTTVDTLFDGTLTAGNSTSLSKSIANYRQIVIECAIDNDITITGCTQISIISPRLNVNYIMSVTLVLNGNTTYNNACALKFTDNTHLEYDSSFKNTWANKPTVKRVIGVH